MNKIIWRINIVLISVLAFLSTSGQTRVLEVTPIYSGVSNWCWASTSTIISTYYGNSPAVCGIAEWARINLPWTNLGDTACCTIPTPKSCNKGILKDDIISILKNSQGVQCDSKPLLSLSSIYFVVNDNRPLIMGCQSISGGGHVMVLCGYTTINSTEAMIHYIDNGEYYSDLYSEAISGYVLGQFGVRWIDDIAFRGSIVPTTKFCPTNLSLHNSIGANANIHAQNIITSDGSISNNCSVTLTAGSSIILNPGFEIQSGSSLTAITSSTPCQ